MAFQDTHPHLQHRKVLDSWRDNDKLFSCQHFPHTSLRDNTLWKFCIRPGTLLHMLCRRNLEIINDRLNKLNSDELSVTSLRSKELFHQCPLENRRLWRWTLMKQLPGQHCITELLHDDKRWLTFLTNSFTPWRTVLIFWYSAKLLARWVTVKIFVTKHLVVKMRYWCCFYVRNIAVFAVKARITDCAKHKF